jgi:hypothetical protein
MGLKDRLRQLERKSEGEMVLISQPGGSVARFPKVDLADAFIVALDRELGRTTEDHPLCQAARYSPDPKWSESVFAGPEVVLDSPPDLSEP